MRPLRAVTALALPAVLLAACAEGPKEQTAAPLEKPVQQQTQQPELTSKHDAVVKPQTKAEEKKVAKQLPAAEQPSSRAAGARPLYNNPAPRGFKRYRAPGAYNVNHLIYPKREIFGVFHEAQDQLATRNALGNKLGVQPNMVKRFYAWNTGFDTAWAQGLWANGAIPQVEWENKPELGNPTVAQIANGSQNDYIRQFAKSVRQFNRPVVMSWGHEMNGYWYGWGWCSTNNPAHASCKVNTKPWQFRAAWRNMVKIFREEGATNAIWNWSVNSINPMPKVPLKPFWPGAAYVDWVGVVGYNYPENKNWPDTFAGIFDRTFVQIRKFTKKPIILNETATASFNSDGKDVKNFLYEVARRKYVIGFIWFDYNKKVINPTEENWSLEASPAKFNTFKYYIRKYPFGFDPKR